MNFGHTAGNVRQQGTNSGYLVVGPELHPVYLRTRWVLLLVHGNVLDKDKYLGYSSNKSYLEVTFYRNVIYKLT